MRVGIPGSGLMGGKLGTIFARAGHEVVFSYSYSNDKLKALARDAGGKARASTPADAAMMTYGTALRELAQGRFTPLAHLGQTVFSKSRQRWIAVFIKTTNLLSKSRSELRERPGGPNPGTNHEIIYLM